MARIPVVVSNAQTLNTGLPLPFPQDLQFSTYSRSQPWRIYSAFTENSLQTPVFTLEFYLKQLNAALVAGSFVDLYYFIEIFNDEALLGNGARYPTARTCSLVTASAAWLRESKKLPELQEGVERIALKSTILQLELNQSLSVEHSINALWARLAYRVIDVYGVAIPGNDVELLVWVNIGGYKENQAFFNTMQRPYGYDINA